MRAQPQFRTELPERASQAFRFFDLARGDHKAAMSRNLAAVAGQRFPQRKEVMARALALRSHALCAATCGRAQCVWGASFGKLVGSAENVNCLGAMWGPASTNNFTVGYLQVALHMPAPRSEHLRVVRALCPEFC